MTPGEQAALERFEMAWRAMLAARLDLNMAARECSDKMVALASALQASSDRELAGHPDLAELNVCMDALYD